MNSRRDMAYEALFLILLFVIPAVLLLAAWGARPEDHLSPGNDPEMYVMSAEYLARGQGLIGSYSGLLLRNNQPPLAQIILGGMLLLFGRVYWAMILPNLLWAAFIPLATYSLVRRFGSRLAAGLAGLGSAFYFHYWEVALSPWTEPLYILLVILAASLSLDALKRKDLFTILIAGFFWGLSALVRSNTVVFFPLIAIWFFFAIKEEDKKKLKASGIFLLAFGAVLFPYALRNYATIGNFTPLESGGAVAMRMAASSSGAITYWRTDPNQIEFLAADEETVEENFLRDFLAPILHNPLGYVKRVYESLKLTMGLRFWNPKMYLYATFQNLDPPIPLLSFNAFFLLGLAGFVVLFRNGEWRSASLMILVFAGALIPLVLGAVPDIRYRLPFDWTFIATAGVAVAALFPRSQEEKEAAEKKSGLPRFLAGCVLLGAFFIGGVYLLADRIPFTALTVIEARGGEASLPAYSLFRERGSDLIDQRVRAEGLVVIPRRLKDDVMVFRLEEFSGKDPRATGNGLALVFAAPENAQRVHWGDYLRLDAELLGYTHLGVPVLGWGVTYDEAEYPLFR